MRYTRQCYVNPELWASWMYFLGLTMLSQLQNIFTVVKSFVYSQAARIANLTKGTKSNVLSHDLGFMNEVSVMCLHLQPVYVTKMNLENSNQGVAFYKLCKQWLLEWRSLCGQPTKIFDSKGGIIVSVYEGLHKFTCVQTPFALNIAFPLLACV